MIAPTAPRRLRVEVTGAVQGVGFRPWVYRTAVGAGLTGWVVNDVGGVRLEVEGRTESLEGFLHDLRASPPPRAVVTGLVHRWLEPAGFDAFTIRESDGDGPLRAAVLPDVATCPACLAEVLDPADRRHGYAFTNCTDCGPRLTIVRDLPYDRPLTTMVGFPMCPACAAEYADPMDRRFHAQPNACPDCGPRLSWVAPDARPGEGDAVDPAGGAREDGECVDGDPLGRAVRALAAGLIVAVKGVGGFHLVCDARNEAAVAELRARKGRPTRPLAVMVRDLEEAERLCVLSVEERTLLAGPEAPIVLARRRNGSPVAPSVAPDHPRLGLMLPYTPLHHLLLRGTGFPVVCTSGNLSEEPICTDGDEARIRLAGVADRFLLHDRPIERPVDDSVATVVDGAPMLLRRSRGFAPLPVALSFDAPTLLAVGGHQKNTVGLARGGEAWLGPHVGDLSAPESQAAFRRSAEDLLRLYRCAPEAVVHDLHPDYASTLWAVERARELGVPAVAVQHHHAHLASVVAEHGLALDAEVTGIVWDGTGLGTDGTIWGGEVLGGSAVGARREARLRSFRLPGGEAAVRDPRRVAFALLTGAGLPTAGLGLSRAEGAVFTRMLERGVSAPVTSSAGRLFDGVSALLGLARRASWEGEPAVRLEHAVDSGEAGAYELPLVDAGAIERVPGDPAAVADVIDGPAVLDWVPTLHELVRDLRRGVSTGVIAARFHNAALRGMLAAARASGRETVVLSGGCFQNRILTERAAGALRGCGFRVLTNRRVPPNDGGLALGQLAVAAARSASPPGPAPADPDGCPPTERT